MRKKKFARESHGMPAFWTGFSNFGALGRGMTLFATGRANKRGDCADMRTKKYASSSVLWPGIRKSRLWRGRKSIPDSWLLKWF